MEAEDEELARIRERMAKQILTQRKSDPTPSGPATKEGGMVELHTAEFDNFLAAHPRVVVDLWAAWCGPCRALSPVLEDLSRALAGQVDFAKVNVDEEPAIAGRYGVQSIPTVLGFLKGRLAEKWVGARPRPEMETLIRRGLLGESSTIRFPDR